MALSLFATLLSSAALASDRIVVDVIGEGDAVLFIPGLTSSPDVFTPFTKTLDGVHVHHVTLAGFGGVPAPDNLDAFTRPAADALAAYIESHDLTDVRLVGHSMGGIVALLVAADIPERIDSILIIDSVPFLAGLMQPGAEPEAMSERREAMRAQFDTATREEFLGMMRQGLPIQATSPESQAIVWADIERADQVAVAIAASEIFATDFRPVLDDVEAPVTVVVPHNPFTGMTAEFMADRYRGQYDSLDSVDIRIVDNSRHFIMLDQPEIFAAELNRFLTEDDQ